MKISLSLMKQAGIYPKLQLGKRVKGMNGKISVQSTGQHKVKIISDKIQKGRDRENGDIIDVVKYVFEDAGELREYLVPLKSRETGQLHYLIQRLSDLPEGTEILMEMKKRGPRNYVEVLHADGTPIQPVEEVEDTHDGVIDDDNNEQVIT